MNIHHASMTKHSLKMAVAIVIVAGTLMSPVFSDSPVLFNRAFVDGAFGINSNKVSSDKIKLRFESRLGVGYGYDGPYSNGREPLFNLSGLLSYSVPLRIERGKIKNRVGFLFQPGYYLPKDTNHTLFMEQSATLELHSKRQNLKILYL